MREVFVDYDAPDDASLLQLSPDLPLDLDQVEVHVPVLQVCDAELCGEYNRGKASVGTELVGAPCCCWEETILEPRCRPDIPTI